MFQVTGVTENVEQQFVGKPPPPKVPKAPLVNQPPPEREDSEKEGEEPDLEEQEGEIVYENAREPELPPEPADPDEYAPSLPDPNMVTLATASITFFKKRLFLRLFA